MGGNQDLIKTETLGALRQSPLGASGIRAR
jgi:hypothetical protein